jgi:hypothetical protein
MNIQELLDHIYEVKDTLSNGLVGQRASAYANNFNNNLQTNFPALKANPTIDDIVNTGLNFAVPLNIKAWHGSPHKFTKFSDDAIGTGEGAQAFGMGHYSGENAPLLDSYYRKRLSNSNVGPSDFHKQHPDYFDNWYKERAQKYADQYDWGGDQPDWGKVRYEAAKDFDSLLGAALDSSSYLYSRPDVKFSDTANFMMDWAKKQQKNPGYLYELNLKPDLEDLLHFDKPISEQSQVLKPRLDAVASSVYDRGFGMSMSDLLKDLQSRGNDVTGRTFYQKIGTYGKMPDESISALLKDFGIPGHAFYGEGGKGLNNFVIYNPADIEIKRRIRGGFDSPMKGFVDYLRQQSMNKADVK